MGFLKNNNKPSIWVLHMSDTGPSICAFCCFPNCQKQATELEAELLGLKFTP